MHKAFYWGNRKHIALQKSSIRVNLVKMDQPCLAIINAKSVIEVYRDAIVNEKGRISCDEQ